jgi:hypothetical protein
MTMSIRRRKGFGAIALFLAFATAQTYIQLSFAEPGSTSWAAVLPQRVLARLNTTANRPISINGVSASSGDTVGTGATIETPPGVAATIDLGLLGKFDLAPGTKIKLEFDENCTDPEKTPSTDDPNDRRCKVKATVMAGCVSGATGKKGSRIEIADEQGNLLDSEQEKQKKGGGGGLFNVCVGPNGFLSAPSTGGGFGTAAILSLAFAGGSFGILCGIYCPGGNPSTSIPPE